MRITTLFKSIFSPIGPERSADELNAEGFGGKVLSLNQKPCQFWQAPCEAQDNSLFCQAQNALDEGDFETCIALYKQLAVEFPNQRDYCESQIAEAYSRIGQYKKSIEYYTAARVHGADETEVDEKVWTQCTHLCCDIQNNNGRKDVLQRYLTLFPKGKYAEEARTLLIAQ
jgi:tetratricopeptide (TPR) repeat protein